MNQKDTCILVFDVENFLYAVRNDDLIHQEMRRLNTFVLLLALIRALEDLIRNKFFVIGRFAALAFPQTTHPRSDSRRPVLSPEEIQKCLLNHAFSVSLEPHEKNAADNALVQRVAGFIEGQKPHTCIIATGDGRDPFPRFIQDLLARAIAVHVVSYDYTPESVRDNSNVRYSLLAADVRTHLQEFWSHPAQKDEKQLPSLVLVRRSVRDYYRALQNSNVSAMQAIDPTHRLWIIKTLEAIKSLTPIGTRWELKFSEIHNAVKSYALQWPDRPPHEELVALLQEMIRSTNLFGRTSVYTPNWESGLWKEP